MYVFTSIRYDTDPFTMGVRKVWTLAKMPWPGIKFMDFSQVLGKSIEFLDFSRAGKHFFCISRTFPEFLDRWENGVNSDFEVKFDLEGQGQLPLKTIGALTKVFCIFGPNLAILAWTGPELSRGQAIDWHTDRQTHTHRRRQRQYPKAKTGLG